MDIDNFFIGFLVALILTILIEGVVYLTYKKDKNLLLASVAANLVTNPLLNFLIFILDSHSTILIYFLEFLVVVAEYLIIAYLGYRGYKIFILVFIANLISFLLGIALFGFNF